MAVKSKVFEFKKISHEHLKLKIKNSFLSFLLVIFKLIDHLKISFSLGGLESNPFT